MTPANDEQTLELVPPDPAFPEAGRQAPEAEEADADPPAWVQQASLSELLLWRLGLPIDREQMEREQQKAKDTFDLKPPITTRKVADAIAHLSMQLMRGELDATSAKTSLYALQTLLTALRLQILEEKKPNKAARKRRKPRHAKRSSQR